MAMQYIQCSFFFGQCKLKKKCLKKYPSSQNIARQTKKENGFLYLVLKRIHYKLYKHKKDYFEHDNSFALHPLENNARHQSNYWICGWVHVTHKHTDTWYVLAQNRSLNGQTTCRTAVLFKSLENNVFLFLF